MESHEQGEPLRGRLIPYGRAELRRLYDPASIAVIGASPRETAFGARTVANLAGYVGRVFLVNERYERIGDRPCFPSLSALPEVPDLVVASTPAASVEAVVADCAEAGIGGVAVYASGFAELGTAEAAAAQARLSRRAAEAGVRLLGPNCVGLLNYVSGARVTFAAVPDARPPRPGAIGLVSQSGALGLALAQAMDRGGAGRHGRTAGPSADGDVPDGVAALAEDPACGVIACAFEGCAEPRRMLAAAERAAARGKPLVMFKLATGHSGAEAALSHTGSLAGANETWQALFARGGAVVVEAYEDLIETASFLGKMAALGTSAKAAGAAVLAGSGGAAIMGADCAERQGVPLPQPCDRVRAVLEARIPSFGSPRNPCDVTAQVISDSESLIACADALLSDEGYGALVYGWTYAYGPATARIPQLSALGARYGKPVCAVWLPQQLEGPGSAELEADPHLAVFRSMDRCFATLAAWTAWCEPSRQPSGPVLAGPTLPALPPGDATLGEAEAKALVAACGVSVSRDIRVADAAGAARAAEAIGGPVVLKIDSPDIAHKTEAGGVVLGIEGGAAAAAAHDAIRAACARAVPAARIAGVLVQEMVPPGVEILFGAKNDPAFGLVVVVGLGGVMAELLRDTVTALAPVSEAEAEAMLGRLRGAALLDGFRGAPAVERRTLAQAVSRLSHLACTLGDRLVELDFNPLICRGDRIVVVDGLVVLRPAQPA